MVTPRLCGRRPSQRLRARLAQFYVAVVHVAHSADRRHAILQHAPHFPRRKLQQRIAALAGNQTDFGARRARHLPALAGPQLYVVDQRPQRYLAQRKRVAYQDVGIFARHDLRSDLEADRLQNVALLAVGVVQQRYVRRAVRIVFDRRDRRRDIVLLPLEIDLAVFLLGASAAKTDADAALAVPAALAAFPLDQRFLGSVGRDLLARRRCLETPRLRGRPVCLDRHGFLRLLAATICGRTRSSSLRP